MIIVTKRAVTAILNNVDVKDDELITAFTGGEALINSRPLTNQSISPHDDVPLTPNHFLKPEVSFCQIGLTVSSIALCKDGEVYKNWLAIFGNH